MAVAAAASRIAGTATNVGGAVSAVKSNTPKVKVRGGYGAAQRPVVTTMTLVVGINFLHTWLVDKKALPDRTFVVRLAILGFVLALMAEVAPKLGKSMSYLILAAVVFDRSQGVLKELQTPTKTAPNQRRPIPPSPLTPETTPVTLYTRSGPMTTEPVLPAGRPRLPRSPARGAAYSA
jgi:hypothetical protein